MLTKDISIPNCPRVYRVVEIHENGDQTPNGKYRVKRRFKSEATGRWTNHSETFEDLETAKRESKKNLVRNSSAPRTQAATFGEVFERFMIHKEKLELRRGSLDGFRSRAIHFSGLKPLLMSKITYRTIDHWLEILTSAEYRESNHDSRINFDHEFSLLGSVFKYYRNHEDNNFQSPLLDKHREIACARPKDKKHRVIKFLNENEVPLFTVQIENFSLLFSDLACVQLETGMRIGEVAALQRRHIDFKNGEIQIVQHLDWPRRKDMSIEVVAGTKTGANRRVPMSQICREALERRFHEAKGARLFTDPRNHESWLTYRQIQYAYDNALKKAETEIRGTHCLRHTFAVRFLNRTKDIHALQSLLGHASIEETQVYGKYTYASTRAAFRVFEGGSGAPSNDSSKDTSKTTSLEILVQRI